MAIFINKLQAFEDEFDSILEGENLDELHNLDKIEKFEEEDKKTRYEVYLKEKPSLSRS